MRRSWTVLAAAVVALPLAVVGVTSIAWAAPASRPDITTVRTFTVLAHATNFTMINVGGKSIGPGDYVVERWGLRRGGTPAGRPNGQCTINFNQAPSHPAALCRFAFTVTGQGEITADGSVVFAPAPEGFRPAPFTVPVTGGTGSYQNARGQIGVKFLGVAGSRFTFHLIPGNDSSGNLFGVLIRNALHGKAIANSIHGNCAGVAVLADLPGPAGLFHLAGKRISNNTKACAAGEDIPFPLSGVGVALLGATGMTITGNLITGNVPSADTEFSSGILVASGPGDPATAPAGNQVHGNRILRNDPDLFWDQTGSGNSFRGNLCQTSTPAGLCHK